MLGLLPAAGAGPRGSRQPDVCGRPLVEGVGVERTSLGAPLDRCGCRKLLREKSLWSSRPETEINPRREMEKKKVAITGIHNSGKTMFLTSLLWQLEKCNGKCFSREGNIKIRGFRESRFSSRRKNTFQYNFYRNKMVFGKQWPQKTTDIHRFCCQFDRSRDVVERRGLKQLLPSLAWQSQQLDILDIPGERIADAAIAAYDDFGEWSDHMFLYFSKNSQYKETESWLQQVLEVENLDIDTAVWAYRKMLVSFIRDYKPLISPSVFFLDGKGNLLKPEQLENAASERPCGLDADSQFVPLPESVRKANPDLARKIARNFKRYRREMVQPLFNDLMKSDSLIILVDIPSLLLCGRQRYDDNCQIILDLLKAIGGKKFNGKKSNISSSLKRIAFVATKADLVSQNDEKNEHLTYLLKEMNEEQAKSLLPDMRIGWFECIACWSTYPGESENTLKGVPLRNNPEKENQEFSVTPLPDSWPTDWNPEEYRFPDVYPAIPPDVQKPPRHKGLDRVFDFAVIGKEDRS